MIDKEIEQRKLLWRIEDEGNSVEKINTDQVNIAIVTPWDVLGEEYSLKFANKFDIVSPAWFEFNYTHKNNEITVSLYIILKDRRREFDQA